MIQLASADINNGLTGILVLTTGTESLQARMALINSAEETLDLQYYAINNDISSNILIEAVVRAAERGVRVRLLIDDISVGKVQKALSTMNAMENISVRIFNPINRGFQSWLTRLIAFFARMPRAARRMHNKALIADGRAAVTGGRNLGDEYFDAHKDVGFKDVDVMTVGPVAKDIESSFEMFWQNKNSVDIEQLYSHSISTRDIEHMRNKLESRNSPQTSEQQHHRTIRLDDFIKMPAHTPVYAKCEFLSDPPRKVEQDLSHSILRKITDLAGVAKKELLIISPYFVPGHGGVAWLAGIKARGIKIGIVTNSLASTDVVAVHTGYKQYRVPLLQYGIDIFELRQKGRQPRQRPFGRTAPAYASLHAKVYVVDRETGVIGSLNFDPRSAHLNTESALIIHHKGVAEQLAGIYTNITAPESSYKLSLHPGLRWNTRTDGKTDVRKSEPDASLMRRLQDYLIGFLPVERQL